MNKSTNQSIITYFTRYKSQANRRRFGKIIVRLNCSHAFAIGKFRPKREGLYFV